MNDMASTAAAGEKRYLKWYNKVGYGLDDVAGNIVYVLLSAFVMIYFTDTVGLDTGAVDTFVMVSRLFDGFSNVIFGALLDRTETRMGKARSWMLWGFISCAGMIIAILAIPTELGETAEYAWFFIAYTLLSAVFYMANNIAYSSLIALIIRNSSEWVQMDSIRFMFAFGTDLLIQSITVGGVTVFGGGATGWRTMTIIHVLLGLAVNTLSVFSVKELSPEELAGDDDTKQKDDTLTVLELTKVLLSNKCCPLIPVAFLLTRIFMAMLNMGIYFMKCILGDENLLGTFAWAINIPLIVGLLVAPIIVRKFGEIYRVNLDGYVIATLDQLGVLVATYFHNTPLMLVLSAVASLEMSPLQGTSNAVITEAPEHTWLRTGKHIDGLVSSCTSLGVKVSDGIGTATAGQLLATSGHNGELSMQPDSAIQMLYVMYVWFPLIANALVFLLLTRLNVEKANARLREQADT